MRIGSFLRVRACVRACVRAWMRAFEVVGWMRWIERQAGREPSQDIEFAKRKGVICKG